VVRVRGALDRDALAAALGDLVARHESLRTIFPDTLGVPRQLILDASAARPRLAVTSVTEAGLAAALAAAAQHGFDLAGEPPLQVHLFALEPKEGGESEHVLLLLLHHIAGDGWSLAPLARDLGRYYEARSRGGAPALAALPVQYADYTLWQHEVLGREDDGQSAIARQLAFWTDALKGLPDQIDLPSDRPRPAVASHRGDSVRLTLDPELHRGLLGLARASRASLFMVLQAALAALLTRLGSGSDIPIGSPIAGRTDSALDDLVGFFVNTLVLRTDTAGNPSFRALIARVRATNLAAYSHQDMPFERLVEVINPARSLARHPLFQVMLTLQNNVAVQLELPGLRSAFEPIASASAKFDLSVSLSEQRAADGTSAGIAGIVEYATDLFERASVEAMTARLIRLLAAAVADADRPIGSLDILSPDERRTILYDWNATARAVPSATLPELFAAQVKTTPAATAVVFEDTSLTYDELDAHSSQLAHHLRALGLARGGGGGAVRRALAGDAGWAARHPQGRRRLSATRPGLPARAARLHAPRCRRAGAGHAVGAVRSAAAAQRTDRAARCRLARHRNAARQRTGSLPAPTTPRLCHLHLRLNRNPEGRRPSRIRASPIYPPRRWRTFRWRPGDRVLGIASISFDASIEQKFLPLLHGACVVLMADVEMQEPSTFWDFISRHNVNYLNTTPSLLAAMVEAAPSTAALHRTILGGEEALPSLHHRLRDRLGKVPIINTYGPTECCIDATAFVLDDTADETRIPIGRPLANYRAYVLDDGLEPVAGGGCGRAIHRGRGAGARLSRAGGADGGAVRGRSVRPGGEPHVPHRRPRTLARGRGAGFPRAGRCADEAARLPHRAGRD